jgi:hypothetical protein
MKTIKQVSIEKECGVTQISIGNARRLQASKGNPASVFIIGDMKRGDYFVRAIWPTGEAHTFTGLSWGYCGEGCAGFNQVMDIFGAKIKSSQVPIDERGRTNCEFTLQNT